MKIIHLSDLHIGKRVNEFSMIEDQEYILLEILKIIDEEEPDCVIIAGDVYDKTVPSAEAVSLFDDFLYRLSKRNLSVLIISGNHDSPERLSFGNRLISDKGIYISPVYNGKVEPVILSDKFGEINFYLLPFIKPASMKRFFPDTEIVSYSDAVKAAVDEMNIDSSKRNVLITHQFVTGALRSDSEEISVGGTDNVDSSLFKDFDYVALGHIHSPQNVGSPYIRYCGTPLKYSFSEAGHKKSVTVLTMNEKGNMEISLRELKPKRDLREIRGLYLDVTNKKNYENTDTDDYLHITLLDEDDIPDAVGKLRVIYPNLMKLDYDNKRTRSIRIIDNIESVEKKSPFTLFRELFFKQNNREMTEEQSSLVKDILEKITEDENETY